MSEEAVLTQQKLCPKCGAVLEPKAIACPQCGAQVAKPKPDKIELTTGQKIAAAVFILNGLALVAEAFLTHDKDAAQGARGAIVSIVIGAYLFSGRASALTWAKVAAILGGVVYTVINFAQGDMFTTVAQVLFSLTLVGLLFGKAGKVRLTLCLLVIVSYFALEGIGLYMTVTEKPDTTTQANPKT